MVTQTDSLHDIITALENLSMNEEMRQQLILLIGSPLTNDSTFSEMAVALTKNKQTVVDKLTTNGIECSINESIGELVSKLPNVISQTDKKSMIKNINDMLKL